MRRVLLFVLLTSPVVAEDVREEATRAFQWFESLGYPDPAELPFVEFERNHRDEHGFLVRTEGEKSVVFTVDFEIVAVHGPVRRVALDELVCAELGKSWWESDLIEARGPRGPIVAYRTFLFAYACHRRGHRDLALRTWREAKQFEEPRSSVSRRALELLRDAFKHASFETQLAHYRRYAERFPEVAEREELAADIEVLASMVSADRRRRANRRKAMAEMTLGERIEELVYGLQNVHADQTWRFGFEGSFDDDERRKLLVIGLPAVPRLLQAVDDRRFSRSYRDGELLRVSDHALSILSRVSGRTLESGPAAVAWWKEVRERGERAVLMDDVRSLRRNLWRLVRKLVARYPECALDPIDHALAAATNDLHRAPLIRALARLPGDGVTRILLREYSRESPDSDGRCRIAYILAKRGNQEGVAALVEGWRLRKFGGLSVVDALIESGAVEAVRTIRSELPSRRASDWLPVVRALDEHPSLSRELEQEVERLLGERLRDTSRVRGRPACELAAAALSRRYPERYAFDLEASVQDRLAARRGIRRAWERRIGEPVRFPTLPGVEPMPAAAAAALRARLDEPDDALFLAIAKAGLPVLPHVREWLLELDDEHIGRARLEAVAERLQRLVAVARLGRDSLAPPREFVKRLNMLRGCPISPTTIEDLAGAAFRALVHRRNAFEIVIDRESDGFGFIVTCRFQEIEPPERGFASIRTRRMTTGCSLDRPSGIWEAAGQRLRALLENDVREPVSLSIGVVAKR